MRAWQLRAGLSRAPRRRLLSCRGPEWEGVAAVALPRERVRGHRGRRTEGPEGSVGAYVKGRDGEGHGGGGLGKDGAGRRWREVSRRGPTAGHGDEVHDRANGGARGLQRDGGDLMRGWADCGASGRWDVERRVARAWWCWRRQGGGPGQADGSARSGRRQIGRWQHVAPWTRCHVAPWCVNISLEAACAPMYHGTIIFKFKILTKEKQ